MKRTSDLSANWGGAWLDALGDGAITDSAGLARGRTQARRGMVEQLELSPSLARAVVGRGSSPESAQLGVRPLADDRWAELIDDIATQPSESADLLSGTVPDRLCEAALPERGDVSPGCSCGDWVELCVHSAALCHAVASQIDADPFVLLLLRGRGRDELISDLRARRAIERGDEPATSDDHPRGIDAGVPATEAYRRAHEPVQRSPRPPHRPGSMPTLTTSAPAGSGVSTDQLAALVDDAARRAFEMLGSDTSSGLDLGVEADIARRAQRGDLATLSTTTGLPESELRTTAAAWRCGGAAGLAAMTHRWDPPAEAVAPALAAMGAGAKQRRNWVSLGRTQLRIDESGMWWRFEADDELGWLLCAEPSDDPADLV